MWDLHGKPIYVTAKNYRLVNLPEHPNSHHRTIFLHRVIMENHLGRMLRVDEHVHHKNEDRGDNTLDNLEILSGQEHARHHARGRICKGPTLVALCCRCCLRVFERDKRNVHTPEPFCSRTCSTTFYWRTKSPPEHGTYGQYRKGCRCSPCKASNTAKCRQQKARRREEALRPRPS